MAELYLLTFAGGKQYVGVTKGRAVDRLVGHIRKSGSRSRLPVHCALRAHGVPSLKVLLVAELDYVLELEPKVIELFNNPGAIRLQSVQRRSLSQLSRRNEGEDPHVDARQPEDQGSSAQRGDH